MREISFEVTGEWITSDEFTLREKDKHSWNHANRFHSLEMVQMIHDALEWMSHMPLALKTKCGESRQAGTHAIVRLPQAAYYTHHEKASGEPVVDQVWKDTHP
ncbi:hypothetical protein NPIL_305451 [Nephila pilipes]|uniref:Uncharacterized protein n=1 Tax=Nephila pilipes TaxID=299642 RepID=A0A8X6N9W0_NEPPI|nr:hypothetical protein NPIL_305451 [Nephila pilipes]